ncbi:MAG: hypothetical protein ACR2KL_04180 [Nocardioidaceae bacterium]
MTYFVLTIGSAVLSVLGLAFTGPSRTTGAKGAESGQLRTLLAAVLTAGLGTAVVARLFEGRLDGSQSPLLVLFAGVLAVCGGSLAATAVFDLVAAEDPAASVHRAATVLRGGAWIGALERLAVFVSLLAHLPEGVAVVLAVKGLGRYPELRAEGAKDRSGAGERFIIGTMVSLIWAAAGAYLALGAS